MVSGESGLLGLSVRRHVIWANVSVQDSASTTIQLLMAPLVQRQTQQVNVPSVT